MHQRWDALCNAVVLLFFLVAGPNLLAQRTAPTAREKADAERLWEQLVTAKGGRSKLHSVSNMMIVKGDKPPNIQIEFYVYPNRFWEWSKGRIVYDYTDVKMANLDRGVYLFDPQPINADRLQPRDGGTNYRESWMIEASLFLLETKWLQPDPVRIRSVRLGKKRWDVLETVFSSLTKYKGWGIDYYIDPETFEIQMAADCNANGKSYTLWIFDGQSDVSGIRVPKSMTARWDITDLEKTPKISFLPLTFLFNTEYDEKLFERPPSADAGPDAWRKKSVKPIR